MTTCEQGRINHGAKRAMAQGPPPKGGPRATKKNFKAKSTKFDFGWSSAPDPARAARSAPPDLQLTPSPLSALRASLNQCPGMKKSKSGHPNCPEWMGTRRL